MTPVYCEDCRWCRRDGRGTLHFARCGHVNATVPVFAQFVSKTLASKPADQFYCAQRNATGECPDWEPTP